MDYRKILIEATNDYLDDEDDVIDLDTIETNPEIPAYLRKPIDKDEPAIDDDDIEVPAHLRDIDKTVDEPEVKVTNVEIPAFVRLEPRTDYDPVELDDITDPINNVPEDEEVPAFLRAKGAKVHPDDLEKPTFARKKAAEIIKGSGAELRRFESVNYFLEGFDDDVSKTVDGFAVNPKVDVEYPEVKEAFMSIEGVDSVMTREEFFSKFPNKSKKYFENQIYFDYFIAYSGEDLGVRTGSVPVGFDEACEKFGLEADTTEFANAYVLYYPESDANGYNPDLVKESADDDDDDIPYQQKDRRLIKALAQKLGLEKNKYCHTANWVCDVWNIATEDGINNGIFLSDGEDGYYYVDERTSTEDGDEFENIFKGDASEMVAWLTPEKVAALRQAYHGVD